MYSTSVRYTDTRTQIDWLALNGVHTVEREIDESRTPNEIVYGDCVCVCRLLYHCVFRVFVILKCAWFHAHTRPQRRTTYMYLFYTFIDINFICAQLTGAARISHSAHFGSICLFRLLWLLLLLRCAYAIYVRRLDGHRVIYTHTHPYICVWFAFAHSDVNANPICWNANLCRFRDSKVRSLVWMGDRNMAARSVQICAFFTPAVSGRFFF